ncbi:hypothetical protein C8J57DRAFT_1576229 [Mycena rebaudengoi]|nr:hypothetical protein C8J57DRAFT_1576229 [Mycena rebaudengoi]
MPMLLPPKELANAKSVLLTSLRSPRVHVSSMFLPCFILLHDSKFKETPELLRGAMDFLLRDHGQDPHAKILDLVLSKSPSTFPTVEGPRITFDPEENTGAQQLLRRQPAQFRTPSRSFNRKAPNRRPWPIGEADIGLGGRSCSEVVALLLRWAGRAPCGHAVFSLLGALIQFWRPFTVAILQDPDLVRLLESHLSAAVRRYHMDPDPTADFFCRIARSCGELCKLILGTTIHLNRSFPGFVQGLCESICGILPLLERQGAAMDDTRVWLSGVLPGPLRISLPAALCPDELVPGMAYMDDFVAARNEMMACVSQSMCMRIGCDAPPGTAVLTMKCGACEVCQDFAYRAEKLPHRQVCKLIASIRQPVRSLVPYQKKPDKTVDLLASTWLSGTTELGFRTAGLSAQTCRAIWINLSFLRRAKGITQPCGLLFTLAEYRRIPADLFDYVFKPGDFMATYVHEGNGGHSGTEAGGVPLPDSEE